MPASERVRTIQQAAEQVAAERLQRYRAAVRKVAEGADIDPEDVVNLCELCAVPVEQFGEDVGLIEERIKAAKLLAEVPAIRAEKARLDAELQAECDAFNAVRDAWAERARAIEAQKKPLEARETEAERARRKLSETFAKANPEAAAVLDAMRREYGDARRAADALSSRIAQCRRDLEYSGNDAKALAFKRGAALELPDLERRGDELRQRENELRVAVDVAEAAVLRA